MLAATERSVSSASAAERVKSARATPASDKETTRQTKVRQLTEDLKLFVDGGGSLAYTPLGPTMQIQELYELCFKAIGLSFAEMPWHVLTNLFMCVRSLRTSLRAGAAAGAAAAARGGVRGGARGGDRGADRGSRRGRGRGGRAGRGPSASACAS